MDSEDTPNEIADPSPTELPARVEQASHLPEAASCGADPLTVRDPWLAYVPPAEETSPPQKAGPRVLELDPDLVEKLIALLGITRVWQFTAGIDGAADLSCRLNPFCLPSAC
jgi:hypothetical protein